MVIHGVEVSKKRLAELLGVHPNTVTAWVRDGKLPPIVDLHFAFISTMQEASAGAVERVAGK
jgi:predicted site-specific integrase-resolvase